MQTEKRSYQFAQEPRPVRRKYRDPFAQQEPEPQATNLMWDRRVFRGNTYAAQVLPLSAHAEQELKMRRKQAERTRKRRAALEAQKRQREAMEQQQLQQQQEQQEIEGRQHIEIQTDMFLQRITDRTIEEDVGTQTDPFHDRPDSPIYIPAKTGVDVATQIQTDLFDFNFEVEPILEVLVGKTLEQSMLEVMEEEEMAELKKHQLEFEQRRAAELAETQRLEAGELRRFKEKEHAKLQERERLKREQRAKQKIEARQFSKKVFQNLEGRVLQKLEEQGYFFDVVERQVESEFMPWLKIQVQKHLDKAREAQTNVDQLIQNVVMKL